MKIVITGGTGLIGTKLASRLREKGRMMPEGLEYVSSWIDVDLTRCFQLMRTEDADLFPLWTDNWKDLMEFEIVPVRTSAEVVAIMKPS